MGNINLYSEICIRKSAIYRKKIGNCFSLFFDLNPFWLIWKLFRTRKSFEMSLFENTYNAYVCGAGNKPCDTIFVKLDNIIYGDGDSEYLLG